MLNIKNISLAFAALVLAVMVMSMPLSAQQNGAAAQGRSTVGVLNHTMSMQEMVQKMHQIMNETSQMERSAQGNSQGRNHMNGNMQGMNYMNGNMQGMNHMNGNMQGVNHMNGNMQGMKQMNGMMAGGNCMMPMHAGMNNMVPAMNGMVAELNGMLSGQKMMKNKQYKDHVQHMQKQMSSMMYDFQGMLDNRGSTDPGTEK